MRGQYGKEVAVVPLSIRKLSVLWFLLQLHLQTSWVQVWTVERLRQYICWVKEAFQPDMSREAEHILLAYWQMARGRDDRQAARSTVRMLESLVRLSQVHLCALCVTECLQSSNIIATKYSVIDSQLVMVRMQAHARLMARHIVSRQDAAVAIMLVEACSDTSGSLSSGDVLQSRCPADPDTEHMKVEARITTTLSAWQGTLNNY